MRAEVCAARAVSAAKIAVARPAAPPPMMTMSVEEVAAGI
jgi:hypothetical protein